MITANSLNIPVAVLAERRPATSPWAEWVWSAAEVLDYAPEAAPWTVLREEAGRTLFLAGATEIWLHPTDTDNYKHNLESASPRIWVVLRPVDAAPGMALQCVTVDAGEAHLYADSGSDLLESLPMPAFLLAPVTDFVARHHQERGFYKRKRDRADPEALARRSPMMDDE